MVEVGVDNALPFSGHGVTRCPQTCFQTAVQVCGYADWVWYGEAWLINAQTPPKFMVSSCCEMIDFISERINCGYDVLATTLN